MAEFIEVVEIENIIPLVIVHHKHVRSHLLCNIWEPIVVNRFSARHFMAKLNENELIIVSQSTFQRKSANVESWANWELEEAGIFLKKPRPVVLVIFCGILEWEFINLESYQFFFCGLPEAGTLSYLALDLSIICHAAIHLLGDSGIVNPVGRSLIKGIFDKR